ncbi:hypothetical protein GCM10027342_44440 [Photobacterium alginatilyticum]
MEGITLTPEQFSQLLDVILIYFFAVTLLAVFIGLMLWDAFSYLIGKLYVWLRVRHIKRVRNISA